jgi:hypothetical protein
MFCCVLADNFAIKSLKIDYTISDQSFLRLKRIRLMAKNHEILSYFDNFEPKAEKF